MRKSYEEPVITVRKYQLKSEDVVMTSDPQTTRATTCLTILSTMYSANKRWN